MWRASACRRCTNGITRVAKWVPPRLAAWLFGLCVSIGPVDAVAWVLAADSRLGCIATAEGEPVMIEFSDFAVRPVIDASGSPTGFDVSVDLRSVDSGDPEQDATLRDDPWFDTQAHPQARFRSQAVMVDPDGAFAVRGDLLLNGVEISVAIPFNWRSTPAGAEMDGKVELDRHRFGIGPDVDDAVAAQVVVFFDLSWRGP